MNILNAGKTRVRAMRRSLIAVAIFAGMAAVAQSQTLRVPNRILYQGRLTDIDGNPVSTGTYTLEFAIYEVKTEGSALWGPQIFDGGSGNGHQPQVPVKNGYYTVLLGSWDTQARPIEDYVTSFPRYLSVKLGGQELLPRQEFFSAPYVLHAGDAQTLGRGKVRVESGVVRMPDGFRSDSLIESTTGGFKFPDGGVRTKAPADMGGKVVIVAKSGGHYTNIQTAINSITDAGATNPYIIWIAPGEYTLSSLTMKDYVSLLGAGQKATIIRLEANAVSAYVANHMSIQNLTIRCIGLNAGAQQNPVYCSGKSGVLLKDVLVDSTNSPSVQVNSVRLAGTSDMELENVTILGGFYGVYASATGQLTLKNCHIETASTGYNDYAIRNQDAAMSILVRDSYVKGTDVSVGGAAASAITAARCQLIGTVDGTANIVYCYNVNFDPRPDQ